MLFNEASKVKIFPPSLNLGSSKAYQPNLHAMIILSFLDGRTLQDNIPLSLGMNLLSDVWTQTKNRCCPDSDDF